MSAAPFNVGDRVRAPDDAEGLVADVHELPTHELPGHEPPPPTWMVTVDFGEDVPAHAYDARELEAAE